MSPTMGDLAERRMKVIRASYAAYNNGDVDGILQNLHPDIELIGANEDGNARESEVWRGHAAARRFYEGVRGEMGLQWVEIVKLEEDGEAIVATVWLHGSNENANMEGAIPAVRRHTFEGFLIRCVETYRQGWELPRFDPQADAD